MDYIRPLLSLIHYRQPHPSSLEVSSLAFLPTEILQHIASYLSPPSAAVLALTCSSIRLATGTQYLTALRTSRAETLTLLELLLLDIPNDTTGIPSHLLCVFCLRLVPSTLGCGGGATEACKEAYDFSKEHLDDSFHHPFFHTAMAMHRHGHSTDAVLARLTPPTSTIQEPNGITTQRTTRYRIVSGSLLRRTQKIHILPRNTANDYNILSQFCPHTVTYQDELIAGAALLQKAVHAAGGEGGFHYISCCHCRTVIHLGARKFRARGIGIFVTWWLDLGDGRVANEKWPGQAPQYNERGELEVIPYDPRDIVNKFQGRFWSIDGLSTRAETKELLRLSPVAVGAKK